MSHNFDTIKSSYGEFYPTAEPFTSDNTAYVPIMGIMQKTQDNLAQLTIVNINDSEHTRCKAQNDLLCKRLKTELDTIAFNRNNLLDEYNSLNDSLTGCNNKRIECSNMKINISNKISEYNTIGLSRPVRQKQIDQCDVITKAIESETIKQSQSTANITRVKAEIDQIKREYNDQLAALAEDLNQIQARINRATFFEKFRLFGPLTRSQNKYKSFKRSGQNCINCDCASCISKTAELTRLQGELTQSTTSVANKRAEYNNPAICPTDRYSQYNAIDTNQSTVKRAQTFLQQTFDTECINLPNCETKYRSLVDAKYAEYKLANLEYSQKEEEYNTCIDPTKNSCSKFYNKLVDARTNLNENVDAIVNGLNQEGFCDENNGIDACIDHTKASADKLYGLRSRVNRLPEEIYGKNGSHASLFMQSKYHADSTMYANIILTTASISILYYMFSRIK
jgi:hypothetical protein